MFLFFLTFEAGHVLKVVLKFWPNLRLNVLIKFVLKKKKSEYKNPNFVGTRNVMSRRQIILTKDS